jgi:hypothetical protein
MQRGRRASFPVELMVGAALGLATFIMAMAAIVSSWH